MFHVDGHRGMLKDVRTCRSKRANRQNTWPVAKRPIPLSEREGVTQPGRDPAKSHSCPSPFALSLLHSTAVFGWAGGSS
jgi:hypothetical protein